MRGCRKISHESPATVAIYANATATRHDEVREFRSFDELERWLCKPIAKPTDKRDVPLFARARVDGPRKKKNLTGPLLVVLDVDKSDASMDETLGALDMQGVAAVAHTTWSHGKAPGLHSYRVFVDQVCDDWNELQAVTRELFRLCALEPTPESWHSPCFFVPAAPDSRRRLYRSSRTELEESEWEAKPFVPGLAVEREGPSHEASPEDEELVRSALERVENGPRDDWITVGMALCSSGIPDARGIWDEWSRSQDYPDYSDDAQERAWASFDPEASEGVGVGTILHMARERGWRRPRQRASAREDFAAFLPARDGSAIAAASPRERLLLDLNAGHAYLAVGQGMVADLSDPNKAINLRSTRAFAGLYAHPRVSTGQLRADGTPILASLGKEWLEKWPRRRTYKDADFLPEGGPEDLPADTLNLWRGWPRFDAGPGSAEPWLDHCREVACGSDERLWNWLLAWMAHLVQRPWEKPGTALVLRGNEGVGKGVLASTLVTLCGAHGLHVTQPNQLTGNFNSHMAAKLLVFADEVTWGGHRQKEGVLKALITEPTLMIEPKGVDAFPARSFCRVVISSNNDWVIPAGPTARRFQFLDVGDARAGDRAYFDRIMRELRSGGYRDLLRRLREARLEELPNARAIISTRGLLDQKLESLRPTERWIFDAAMIGKLIEHADDWSDDWISSEELRESYLKHARDTGATRRSAEMIVSRKLKEMLGDGYQKQQRSHRGRRVVCYRLPRLSETRRLLEKWLGQKIDWEA